MLGQPIRLDGVWKVYPDPNNVGEEQGFHLGSYDDSNWFEARVPGHWQEEIPQLRNFAGIAWYRRKFTCTRRPGRRIWLKFGGVFYRATVWLNGEKLGTHEGYFGEFKFDVTEVIKEENIVAVKVESYDERNPNKKTQIGGIFYHWDCRDPTFNPGGIWRSVEIYETGDIWIERVKVITKVKEDGAELRVLVWLGSAISGEARLNIKIFPKNFEGKSYSVERSIEVSQGTNLVEETIIVDEPKLWWTWDLGKQNLYILQVGVYIGDDISDTKNIVFGIRDIRAHMRRSGWVLYLNGKRLFIRGTNYGPTSQRVAYVTKEMIERDVKLMREANINMVRIHAYINPEVLSVFDEYGILVWQDMPLQWLYSKKIRDAAIENAKEFVRIVENHASVAIINCHNEPFKIPDKSDAIGGLISFVISLLLSLIIGSLGIRFDLGIMDVPIWTDTVRLLEQPLIGPIKIGVVVSIILALILFYPAVALACGGYEALAITIILGMIFPWDIILFLGCFLILSGSSITALVYNWNKNVLDRRLEKVIMEEDMGVHAVVMHSGIFGWFINGTDIHIYDGWYTGWLLPFRRLRGYRHAKQFRGIFRNVPRFVSEYGAQAFPCVENLMKMLPDDIREELDKKGFRKAYKRLAEYLRKYHQYQPGFMKLWINPEKFDRLEDFIEATQEYQAELIKFYNEYWRSRRFNPTGGALQFMFTDIAPAITWAVIDYWRTPKKAYYVLKETFKPTYIFMEWPKPKYKAGKKYRTKIYIVNDLHKEFDGTARFRINDEIVWEKKLHIPEDTLIVENIIFIIDKKGKHTITLELIVDEEIITNNYTIYVS